MVSEVQFSFDALSFLKEALPEQEAPKPTESLVTRKAPTVEPVKAQDENQTMLRDFATRLNDRYDLAKISEPPKQPVVRGSMIQEYLDSVEQYSRDEKMRSSVDRALAEAMQPKIGESPSRFSPASEEQSQPSMDARSNELLEKPLQEDGSIEIVDAPDAQKVMPNPPEVKEEGLMSRPEVVTAEVEPLTDDDMGLPSDAGFTAKDAQKALGFTGSAVDGKFGPNSRKKLLEFQRKSGIPLTGDFNDPATRAALMNPDSTDPRKVESIYASPDLTTSGSIDIDKVTGYIKTIVQNPLKAAGIIGIIRQELGEGSIRTEDMGYRLGKKATANSPATGAYAVFDDSDVDAAFASLSTTEQTRAKTNVPMNALGRAIMDIKYDGGHQYRGRGLVQITHKDMYKQVGDKIGVDLVANPELVNDPDYAVPAAIALLEIKDYFGKPTTKDNLRRMINPGQTDAKRDDRWQYVEAALSDIRTS